MKDCSQVLLHLYCWVVLPPHALPGEVNFTTYFTHTYILVKMYLPVAFLGDRDPVNRAFVEGVVYPPQDQLTAVLSVVSSGSRTR